MASQLTPFLSPPEIASAAIPNHTNHQALPWQVIEELCTFIRQSAARQIEYAQAIADGAVLAAEQVQDKRLELLEQGPEVTGFDIFMDFALTFILESPLAGKILRAVTTRLLLPRIHANQVAKTKAMRTLALQPGAHLPGGRLATPQRIAADQLAQELSNLHRFERALVSTTSEQGPYPYLVAFTKAVREAASKEQKSPTLEASDTAGVAILEMVHHFMSNRRLAIQVEHSMFELWVRTGAMSMEEIYNTLRWESLTVNGSPFSIAQVRDRFKRHFELLIWTLLLYEKPLTGKTVTTPRQSFTLRGYVQPVLIAYWLKRFINPETESPFSETPALKRPGGKPDLGKAIPTLGNYMWEVAKVAQKNKISLLSSGPLVPRKSLLE